VGTSIGIAIIGVVLTSTLATGIPQKIQQNSLVPAAVKSKAISSVENVSIERGQQKPKGPLNPIETAVRDDVNSVFVDAIHNALKVSLFFTLCGAVLSLTIPKSPHVVDRKERYAQSGH
jgi:hypothetical protein